MADSREVEGEERNLAEVVSDLRAAVATDHEASDVLPLLDSLISLGKDVASDFASADFTDFRIDDVFLVLLRHPSKDVVARSAEAIAHIAKVDDGKERCTNEELVKALVDLLQDDAVDVLAQTCLALGNICCEWNDNGKQLVKDSGGLQSILAMLQRPLVHQKTDSARYLRKVAASFFAEFLSDRPAFQKEALQQDAVPIVITLMEIDGPSDEGVAACALVVLRILSKTCDTFLDERLKKVLMDILESDASLKTLSLCLELLLALIGEDSKKMMLAKAGACELLLNIMEKHSPNVHDSEVRSCLKDAGNLVVLILHGDDSMNLLYNNGSGEVYKKLASWLDQRDKDMQITAMLAMGNFARTDEQSKAMVSQGIHRSLMKIYQVKTKDISFQFAFLGAVKNLGIAPDNRKTMLDDGLLDLLYSMLYEPSYHVIFQFLGTLRIVIGGQKEAAIDLAKRDCVVETIVKWCRTEYGYGVQCEATRLIAWIVSDSRDRDVCLLMVEHGALKPLVNMLTAHQPLMQEEALTSLTVLSSLCLKEAEEQLLWANVGDNLARLVENGEKTLEPKVLRNFVALLSNIVASELLRDHLRKSGVLTSCRKLLSDKDSESSLTEKLQGVCDQLEPSAIQN